MTWFQNLVGVAASKVRGLFPLPDDFAHVRQRADILISSWFSQPDKESFLTVRVFQLNPRMFEQWKTTFYEDLRDALKAETRTGRRRKLHECILVHCGSITTANSYLEAEDPERKACALRLLATSFQRPDEAETELTFRKAGSELSMLILRKLEDEAFPESNGDKYVRAYLDVDAIMVKSGLDVMLCKERGEDAQMSALSYDVARKVAEHLKKEFVSGVASTYSPPEA
jgi:hypothetical protein